MSTHLSPLDRLVLANDRRLTHSFDLLCFLLPLLVVVSAHNTPNQIINGPNSCREVHNLIGSLFLCEYFSGKIDKTKSANWSL